MLIITPCSSTKKQKITLSADDFKAKTLRDYANRWAKLALLQADKYRPEDLYGGQGYSAAQKSCAMLNGEMATISAGQGIVKSGALIPSYNLTIGDRGPNPLKQIAEFATPRDWWLELNRAYGNANALFKLIKKQDSMVIVAISSSYLNMVEEELTRCVVNNPNKFRIIVSTNLKLNTQLDAVSIRYDQRINYLPQSSGVNSSFAQRALLNFAEILVENPRTTSLKSQQSLVEKQLKISRPHKKIVRVRKSDFEIQKVLKKVIASTNLSRNQLLGFLRSKNIACEQQRFNRLIDHLSEAF